MGTQQVYLNNEIENAIRELIEKDQTLPKEINRAVAVIAKRYVDEKMQKPLVVNGVPL